MKIFECSLDYHFPLNSFKISEIFRFFCKNFKFPLALGGLRPPPRTHLSGKYWIIIFCLGGRPSNFRKKLKLQEENLGKIHKNWLASGGSAPRTPCSDIIFNYSYIFVQLRAWNSCNSCKVNKVYITDFDKFPEFFLPSGGSAPRAPHYSMSILDSLFFP